MFRPTSEFSIYFMLPDASLVEWSTDPDGRWLRAMTSKEKASSEMRLLDASAGRDSALLRNSLDADKIWICGGTPQGIPVGLAGKTLLLPQHPDYLISGWLSGHGLYFFPCADNEHEDLAEALSPGGSIKLEGEGWLRIKDADYIPGRGIMDPNPAQESWLRHPAATAL